MRKNPASWPKEKYLYALNGEPGIPGLRSIAIGFAPADGYDFRSFDSWTKYQKQKVRKLYQDVLHLEAQPRKIIRYRNKKTLREDQALFHGDIKSKALKVAFVPYTEPVPLPGAKHTEMRVVHTKNVVWTVYPTYRRGFAKLDQIRLAVDPEKELNRAIRQMKKASIFYVQTGEFQTRSGNSPDRLISQVLQWMNKYDGVSPITTGGNAGDNPAAHKWDQWLNAIIGIETPTGEYDPEISRAIHKGMEDAKARRAERIKKDERRFGKHGDKQLLALQKSDAIKNKDKTQIRRELTTRGIDWKKFNFNK